MVKVAAVNLDERKIDLMLDASMLRGRGGRKVQVSKAEPKSSEGRREGSKLDGKAESTGKPGKSRKPRNGSKNGRQSERSKPAGRAPKKTRSKSSKGKKK